MRDAKGSLVEPPHGWRRFPACSHPRGGSTPPACQRATQILLEKAEDEYRTYFKRPETTYENWAAIKFEIDIGKFDLAARLFNQLMTGSDFPEFLTLVAYEHLD